MKGIRFSSDEEEISLDYLYNIGLNHAKRGKPKDAIFYFDKVLKVEPTHVNALLNKGNALGKLGRYKDAISIYDMALKKNPEHKLCLLNKGLALHYLTRYDEAVACYEKIPLPQADDPNVLYHKACSKVLQKNISESLELLERAILLDSQYAVKASTDKDFDALRNDDRFKALVA